MATSNKINIGTCDDVPYFEDMWYLSNYCLTTYQKDNNIYYWCNKKWKIYATFIFRVSKRNIRPIDINFKIRGHLACEQPRLTYWVLYLGSGDTIRWGRRLRKILCCRFLWMRSSYVPGGTTKCRKNVVKTPDKVCLGYLPLHVTDAPYRITDTRDWQKRYKYNFHLRWFNFFFTSEIILKLRWRYLQQNHTRVHLQMRYSSIQQLNRLLIRRAK